MTENRKNARRYEYIRRMNPARFKAIWMHNIESNEQFDAIIDKLIDGRMYWNGDRLVESNFKPGAK